MSNFGISNTFDGAEAILAFDFGVGAGVSVVSVMTGIPLSSEEGGEVWQRTAALTGPRLF